jgi:2-keto-4-pentenoate hydratase/2-oxohepta-3-ene-1,7-dioic acid hydratase in catechol pathway
MLLVSEKLPARSDSYIEYLGYTVALDLTARNLQSQAKEKGLPWTQSKGNGISRSLHH